MKQILYFLTLLSIIIPFEPFAQSLQPKVKAFKSGEILEYDIYYNWGLIWVNAGTVTFSVKQEIVKDKSLFHFIGEGSSRKNWDWFYKVRDKFESYNDSSTLKPYKYIRNSNDGGEWVYNDITYDFKNNRAIGYIKSKKKPNIQIDTFKINQLTFDPISMIYYTRTIDYEKFKENDIIPISMVLDNQFYNQKITYLGKEQIKTEFGTFNCIKFKPTLIPGTIFKEGDEMTVWVSDDDNRIPIKVETPIVIGSVKAFLRKTTNLKNELTSKVVESK